MIGWKIFIGFISFLNFLPIPKGFIIIITPVVSFSSLKKSLLNHP